MKELVALLGLAGILLLPAISLAADSQAIKTQPAAANSICAGTTQAHAQHAATSWAERTLGLGG